MIRGDCSPASGSRGIEFVDVVAAVAGTGHRLAECFGCCAELAGQGCHRRRFARGVDRAGELPNQCGLW
jgi:hypothetical protein